MKPFFPNQTGRTRVFWLLGTIVLFTFLALPLAFSDLLFQDRFEPVGITPVHFGTVELRDGDEQVKASAETNELGQFPPFATGLIAPGDSIVVYGGSWQGTPFTGEFRLLLADPEAQQVVTPITTLVSAVAAAHFIAGDTPAERLDAAVAWLNDLYMIDADWNSRNPSRVSAALTNAINDASGMQNWIAALLPQIEEGQLDRESMNVFPYANGGILDLPLDNNMLRWLSGDQFSLQLPVESTLEEEPEWAFEGIELPDWASLSSSGELSFQVPEDALGLYSMIVQVTNSETGLARAFSIEFFVDEGVEVALMPLDESGGEIWHPDGSIGYSIPADAVPPLDQIRGSPPELDEVLILNGFTIEGGGSHSDSATGGVTSQEMVVGFTFQGTVAGISDNSTWASDLVLTLTSPDGLQYSVGGYQTEYPPWEFSGSGANSDGTYSSTHIGSDIFGTTGTTDVGTWTFEFNHTWNHTMDWTDVTITLHKVGPMGQMLRLIDYYSASGTRHTTLRSIPPNMEFLEPITLMVGAGPEGDGMRSTDCSFSPDPGWVAKRCGKAPFVTLGGKTNRLPGEGNAWPAMIDALPANSTNELTTYRLSALCDDCSGRTPVLFIHGYTDMGKIGGGFGTWADLPGLIHNFGVGSQFAAYEFRYRTNARFQDVARDLRTAIGEIFDETGQPVHIVAHSFGGLVARTYLQGLVPGSVKPNPPVGNCTTSRHPMVASLVTVGTPHSGIKLLSGTLHDTQLPRGIQGSGNFIPGCWQTSCWQAGSTGALSAIGIGIYDGYLDMFQPGEMIAALSDFSNNPLPVPTLSLVSMSLDSNDRFTAGDGLISYQGQRFAPQLSCGAGSCADQVIGPGPIESIGSHSVGHCVFERVLGSWQSHEQPKPGYPLGLNPPQVWAGYRHTFFATGRGTRQTRVFQSYLPGLSFPIPHTGSLHDTFNRLESWLLDNQADPVKRRLEVRVNGPGKVQVISASTTHECEPEVANSSTACLFEVGPLATVRWIPQANADLASHSPPCSDTQWGCNIRVGAFGAVEGTFTGGGQANLRVTVSGTGSVTVNPGGDECTGVCTYPFESGQAVTLTAQGNLSHWTGQCSHSNNECNLWMGAPGTQRNATANFISPGSTFKDCPECPTMVMIPAGTFTQGAPESETGSQSNERPQRTVNVPSFAMGQTAVTFDQWDACLADGGCSANPWGWSTERGNLPVVNQNWHHAQEYVTWLSNKTGHDYRLPSESEWEYATRAGTSGPVNTGDCITSDQANFRAESPAPWCPTGIHRGQTLPVGSFAPNAFGLYETHGNVFEWVQDCWNESYFGAPTDGSAWLTGDCSRSVLRGGSWFFPGWTIRAAFRRPDVRDFSNTFTVGVGFRVARSVDL